MVFCDEQCETTVITMTKWVSMISGLVGMTLIGYQLYKHLKNTHLHIERHQMRVILVLLFHPIYTIASILSIWTGDEFGIMDTIRGIYEGVLLFSFFDLLVVYICHPPGEKDYKIERMLEIFEEHKTIPYSFSILIFRWPIRWLFAKCGISIFQEDAVDVSDHSRALAYYKHIRFWILQYVITRPIIVLLDLFLIALGWEKKFIDVVLESFAAILLSIVLYYLLIFSHITAPKLNLYGAKPLLKFMLIKGVLGLLFWQNLIFRYAIFTDVHASLVQNENAEIRDYLVECASDALLCVELVIFALIAFAAFNHEPLFNGENNKPGMELTKVIGFVARDLEDAKELLVPKGNDGIRT